ncbi:hypothetical protein JCM10908_004732 [Rhodotorula pacifica]|uniref:uncharacterized protein n=1 Tax=Rhodotorula pacifica TaxID=1495444 RepID=UPI00316F3B37
MGANLTHLAASEGACLQYLDKELNSKDGLLKNQLQHSHAYWDPRSSKVQKSRRNFANTLKTILERAKEFGLFAAPGGLEWHKWIVRQTEIAKDWTPNDRDGVQLALHQLDGVLQRKTTLSGRLDALRASVKEGRTDNLRVALETANGRWGHDAGRPTFWQAHYGNAAFEDPSPPAAANALGRVRLSPRQTEIYARRFAGSNRM